MASDERITIQLSKQEALVLFELLPRWGETNALSAPLEHRAEQRVLWNILGRLESILAEPFMPNYSDQLNMARELIQED
jgi:hypothetical protein